MPPEYRTDTTPDGLIVVYTAISGDYDSLQEPPSSAAEGVEFVAFLSKPGRSKVWRREPIHAGFDDPCRNAKIHKVLPHRYFPDARYSLWMDGSVAIQFSYPVRRLVELYLADCDLAVFQHERRTCIYQEASVCLQRRLDDPAVILQQACRYTREGYPANAGLAESPVILRRHTPAVTAFNEAWWDEIARGSRRDQISSPYVARKTGLRYGFFPGDIRDNPLFRQGPHRRSLVRRASARAGHVVRRGRSWASSTRRVAAITLGPARDPACKDAPSETYVAPAPVEGGPRPDPQGHRAALPQGAARRIIAFGPVRDMPSWHWVGFDVSREISKYHDVAFFDSWSAVPDCDALFVVKERPPDGFAAEVKRRGTRLVYCPVDIYRDAKHLAGDAGFLGSCDMVVAHCERLLPLLRPYCGNAHFVEHHARFAPDAMADYKEKGFILWIGSCQYVPYLVQWLESHPIEHEIRILTDIDDYVARDEARVVAAEIGLKWTISRDRTDIAGHRVYRWSERRQAEMMRDCKGALDIKMTGSFNQRHKPPTKAQQFIAAGVPFAVNPESYSAEYFRVRGFDVASPSDTARWLSRAYWEETRARGAKLRDLISLQAVGLRYRDLIETFLFQPQR